MALAVSIALRPNLAIAGVVLLSMLSLWLASRKEWKELAFLVLGFSPILLPGLHNWYFGGRLVPFSAWAFIPANLHTPPSTYVAAINEVLHLDWAGPNLSRVGWQLSQWNGLSDIYRVPVFLVTIWVALRPGYDIALRSLALIALSLQLVLFFYGNWPRYTFLAWNLVFIVFLVVLRENLLPWFFERTRPVQRSLL